MVPSSRERSGRHRPRSHRRSRGAWAPPRPPHIRAPPNTTTQVDVQKQDQLRSVLESALDAARRFTSSEGSALFLSRNGAASDALLSRVVGGEALLQVALPPFHAAFVLACAPHPFARSFYCIQLARPLPRQPPF